MVNNLIKGIIAGGLFRPFFVAIIFRRCVVISKQEHFINEQIRDKEVRLIDAQGNQVGVVPTAKAQEMAEAANLDLVKIAPNAVPPVCKIMDYGKFRFEQSKREKEARKSQKIIRIKEIKLGLNIDVHDFNTKVKHAERFIADGDKVKVFIRFRGRELGHPELGTETMNRFAQACDEFSSVEKQPKMEGRTMQMFLSPKKN